MFNAPMLKCFSFVFLMGLSAGLVAQSSTYTRGNSPYSRYGLGDLQAYSFTPNQSMGYAFSATYYNAYDYNPQNAATLVGLRAAAFDFGLFYRGTALSEQSTGKTAKAHDGNIGYLSLAIPLTRSWERERDTLRKRLPLQWTMAVNFMPHSQTAYDVRVTRTLPEIGDIQYWYNGQGNRYRINLGQAFGYKGFALGVNAGLLLGRNDISSTLNFQDSSYIYAYDEAREESQFISGFVWNIGLQYRHVLKKVRHPKSGLSTDWALIVGAYGNSQQYVSSSQSGYFRRYGTYFGSDTLQQDSEAKQSLTLPTEYGFGIALERAHYWKIGFNYQANLWSQFQDGNLNSLQDAFLLSLGGEYSPIKKRGVETLRLRAGMFYGRDPRLVNGLNLDKYGITFGLNIPRMIRRGMPSIAFLNLGLELGYMGNSNLIREQYIQVNLAATINDAGWFVRRKYR